MKSGNALIGIYQNLRIKNLMGVSEVRLKKLDSFTLEMPKNHLNRNFLRNGRMRVNNFRMRIEKNIPLKISRIKPRQ